MGLNLKLLRLLVLILIIKECFCYVVIKNEQPKPKQTYIKSFSDNIVNFFNLNQKENLIKNSVSNPVKKKINYLDELLKKTDKNDEPCKGKDLGYFSEYFFDVYSNDKETINEENLREMIKFHLTRGPRSDDIENKSAINKCKSENCLMFNDIQAIMNKSNISNISNNLTRDNFNNFCPFLLYNIELEHCKIEDEKVKLVGWEVWVYGMLLTSVVTLWSWGGLVVFPIITKNIYKRVLTFMISLAFGTLTSNGLLKFIPLADGFDENDYFEVNHSFFYKHLLILVVIFFFFNFERSMKIFAIYKSKKTKRNKQKRAIIEKLDQLTRQMSQMSDISTVGSIDQNPASNKPRKSKVNFSVDDNLKTGEEKKSKLKEKMRRRYSRQQSINVGEITIFGPYHLNQISGDRMEKYLNQEEVSNDEDELHISKETRLCCTSLTKGISQVKPVGWMAIFGDGIGNFIDGLSIGASISQNLTLGITTAIASWFSNIPQELGDFALLVRAGMTPFQALFYNFMSAQAAYVGCMVGILGGSQIESARWIFAVSGATSVYLGLGVLLPELNEEFDDPKESFREKIKVTAIQLMGMITGMGIMILLNMYDEELEKSG